MLTRIVTWKVVKAEEMTHDEYPEILIVFLNLHND